MQSLLLSFYSSFAREMRFAKLRGIDSNRGVDSREFIIMPIFEYICQDCRHEFEALVFGRDQAACPKCRSKKLNPQLSVFAVSSKGVSTKGSSDTPPSVGACGSCGDPRGPGACSLGDLD
jgi:putative FmdB family regulatory protein